MKLFPRKKYVYHVSFLCGIDKLQIGHNFSIVSDLPIRGEVDLDLIKQAIETTDPHPKNVEIISFDLIGRK